MLFSAFGSSLFADAVIQRIYYGAPGVDHIEGLAGNLAWLRSEACADDPPPAQGDPLVAPLGEPLILTFLLQPCGLPAPPPDLSCSWSITPDRPLDGSCRCAETMALPGCLDLQAVRGSFSSSLTDRDGSFLRFEEAFDVPQTIGRYRMEMRCKLDEKPQPTIRQTLFVTHGEPLVWVTPAAEDWLQRSVCWAEGLGSEAEEEQILETLNDGLYRWGRQGNLRYGYARADPEAPEDSGTYLFPTEAGDQRLVFPADAVDEFLQCPGKNCKCHWQNLLDRDRSCDFADCYNFSRTLQGVAATLGVGGLVPFVSMGESDAGFLTPEPSRSIDARFPGNLACEEGTTCYSYLFGSHSVRTRGGKIYDPTFGAIYAEESEMIGAHLLNWSPPSFETSDPEVIVLQKDSEYGNWGFYDLRSAEEQVIEHEGALGARLTGEVSFQASGTAEMGFSSMLLAEVEVEIVREGRYFVNGVIAWQEDGKKPRPIAWHPSIETSTRSRSGIEGEPGKSTVELRFSGEQIYRAGKNGRYQLILQVQDGDLDRVGERLTVPTPEYRAEDFGELGASAALDRTPFGIDWDGDKVYDALVVPVKMSVRVASKYGLELRLHRQNRTIAYSSLQILEPSNALLRQQIRGERELPVGEHIIYGVFLPATIRAHVEDAKHRVTVLVFDDRLRAIAGKITLPFAIDKAKFFGN